MRFTLGELNVAKPILMKIAENSFSGKQAFVIARLLRKLQEEDNTFQEARRNVLLKYATKDEKGNLIFDETGNISFAEEVMQDLNDEIVALLATEVEIDAELIEESWLENVELTPNQVSIILPFIKG